MPIKSNRPLRRIGQDQFHTLDRTVMREVFQVQNRFGQFLSEEIYADELANRCRNSGLEVERELLFKVAFSDFTKNYYADLAVEGCSIYELKAVDSFTAQHENQALNYLLLGELGHGKLVNFRTPSVESRFVSTNLTGEKRKSVTFSFSEDWRKLQSSEDIESMIGDILNDWGAFLDVALYREAFVHFLCPSEFRKIDVSILDDGRHVGTHSVSLIDEVTALFVTSFSGQASSYRNGISKILKNSRLKAACWINLWRERVHYEYVQKD